MQLQFYNLKIILVSLCLLSSKTVFSQKEIDFKHFPKPLKGLKQFIIELNSKNNEQNYLVEFYIGKEVFVDMCNAYGMNGKLEKKTVSGYNFPYYELTSDGKIFSTLKSCGTDEVIEKFITVAVEVIHYNSKLPIVIYAPEGFEIRYRIFKSTEDYKKSKAIN